MARKVKRYRCPQCEALHTKKEKADNCCVLPPLLDEPEIERMRKCATAYLQDVVDNPGGGTSLRDKNSVEALLRGFYGPSVLTWIEKRLAN